jgi:hypothetical protein
MPKYHHLQTKFSDFAPTYKIYISNMKSIYFLNSHYFNTTPRNVAYAYIKYASEIDDIQRNIRSL